MAAPRFADAVAKYDDARIALFGVPYDRTCSFRGGSRYGPAAIRQASYNFETFMMDHQRDILDVPFADLGDTPVFGPSTDMVTGVSKMASDILGAGKVPIAIGGEHSLAPAVVRAFPKDVGVIQIDRDQIYLTIDIDGVAPAYAPGVGNPEPFGIAPIQIKRLLGILGPSLIGLDLNEVSPAWDHGQTALLAARLIREAIMAIGEARS